MRQDNIRSLLLIDADPAERRLVATIAGRAGWRVLSGESFAAAREPLESDEAGEIAAAVVGNWRPGLPNCPLTSLREHSPDLPVIAVLSPGEMGAGVAALRSGSKDFLASPVAADRLLAALSHAVDRRRTGRELLPLTERSSRPLTFDEVIGSAPEFRAALAVAAKAARSRISVLLQGEGGSGKETVARAVHLASPRARREMLSVDCAAVPANMIDSVLFGHVRGAFPGAFANHVGLLTLADGSTAFLDNVDALPPATQAKLLTTIEVGVVEPVGGGAPRAIDMRVIAAAKPGLADRVASGAFREDLFYRLAGIQLVLPPLRERGPDIPALVRHLLHRISGQPGMRPLSISDDALSLLMRYGWPGNVRQLHDALFRAAALSNSNALTAADFPQIARELEFRNRASDHRPVALSGASAAAALSQGPGITLYQADGHLRPLDQIEADVIRLAIGQYQGRMTEVARRLGIGRSTLYRKLAELGIHVDAA